MADTGRLDTAKDGAGRVTVGGKDLVVSSSEQRAKGTEVRVYPA